MRTEDIVPMAVKRVETETGSHIEPALNSRWSEREKLAWKLGVVLADTGLELSIHDSNSRTRIAGIWVRDRETQWNIAAPGMAMGAGNYLDTWSALTYLSIGYELRGRR